VGLVGLGLMLEVIDGLHRGVVSARTVGRNRRGPFSWPLPREH
jgi:hypothetical protein